MLNLNQDFQWIKQQFLFFISYKAHVSEHKTFTVVFRVDHQKTAVNKIIHFSRYRGIKRKSEFSAFFYFFLFICLCRNRIVWIQYNERQSNGIRRGAFAFKSLSLSSSLIFIYAIRWNEIIMINKMKSLNFDLRDSGKQWIQCWRRI